MVLVVGIEQPSSPSTSPPPPSVRPRDLVAPATQLSPASQVALAVAHVVLAMPASSGPMASTPARAALSSSGQPPSFVAHPFPSHPPLPWLFSSMSSLLRSFRRIA